MQAKFVTPVYCHKTKTESAILKIMTSFQPITSSTRLRLLVNKKKTKCHISPTKCNNSNLLTCCIQSKSYMTERHIFKREANKQRLSWTENII